MESHNSDDIGDFHSDLDELPTNINFDENQTYTYVYYDDYFNTIQTLRDAQKYFGLAVAVVLLVALVVMAFTWYRNRERQAYRYAMLMVIIGASLAYQASHFTYSILVNLYGLLDQFVLFSLTGYAVLSAVRALKKTVVASQTLLVVALCIVATLLLALLRWKFGGGIFTHRSTAFVLCLTVIPNFAVLLVGLSVTVLLLYWVFALDNSRYKEHRDYRVIRHGSVCLLLVLLYCLTLEIVTTIFMFNTYSFDIVTMMSYAFFFEAKGLVIGLLLCFLDLEVLGACSCACVDLGDDEDPESDSKPLANDGLAPANEERDVKTHVTSFETEITPRLILQSKPAYGTIQE